MKARLVGTSLLFRLLATFALAGARAPAAERIDSDIAIYGGTSAGVIAAVQAAQLGHRTVLIEPGSHLGGMSAEGLGGSDIDNHPGFQNSPAIGGLALDFYRRLAKHYGRLEAFETMLRERRKQPELWVFEPHVAEAIFDRWVGEAGVRVLRQHRLAEVSSVEKRDARLHAVRCENGVEVVARVWIDATYEGDLLAAAGARFVVGREGNSRYHETKNGIRADTHYSQFERAVDPYRIPGDAASGLIAGVQPGPLGEHGAADESIQGFRFRLVLSRDPLNRISFTKPANYDPAAYELQRRYLQAGGTFQVPRPRLPNDKCEPGVWHHLQSNLTGENHTWNTARYAERDAMLERSLAWQQGLCWFLVSDRAVPEPIRRVWSEWGLAKNEFTDHGGWPRMFYVRNGRRLVSDFVLTEAHVRKSNPEPVSDPVALAWWPPDLHSARRIVKEGAVWNEGAVFGGEDWIPFGIGYRALHPRAAECINLLTPTCPSSSYVSYGALRLEWTFMVIAQSTAIAAAIALDRNTPVQDVPYAELAKRLTAAGQVLRIEQQ